MLRADIRQFSIAHRLVTYLDTCPVALCCGRHPLDYVDSGTLTAIENSLMSARNVGSTAHMSSFTDRRTIKNCLMSARNMRAAAHAPCSQRALSMFTAQILNAKSTDFTLFTDRWRRWRWLVDEGASCHVSLFCSLISTISGSASFTP